MVPAPFSFPLGVIRNSSKGSAVIMRETLIVILNECEGSVAAVRKAGMRIKAISYELSATR